MLSGMGNGPAGLPGPQEGARPGRTQYWKCMVSISSIRPSRVYRQVPM